MSSHVRPKLTLGEISSMIGALPLVVGTIIAFVVTSTWAQWKDGYYRGKDSLRRNAVASFGTMITHLRPRQVRALIPQTTGESIERYCAAHRIPLQSVLVNNDDGFPPARLHFVGCRLEQKTPILLYFHGGGFVVPLHSPAFALSLARSARAGLVLLEYTLAPECVYPGQLAQSVAALRLMLRHREPSDIIVAGESAGGNMAIAVMAHLQQPKAGISPLSLPVAQNQATPVKFRGLLAISPRTTNAGTAPSFRYNSGKDFMSKHSLGAITASWKPAADVWAAPVLARDGFWSGLQAERALLVVGGHEVYKDDVCHVAKTMGASEVGLKELETRGEVEKGYGPALQFIVCPGEMHCQASLDLGLRIHDGYMTRAVIGWLSIFQ